MAPDRRLPRVFYDPRALEMDSHKKACLHAKCIVVDRKEVFVSSANFTEAAQERYLEVGLLIHSPIRYRFRLPPETWHVQRGGPASPPVCKPRS